MKTNIAANAAILPMVTTSASYPMGSSASDWDSPNTESIYFTNTKQHINTAKDPVRQSMKLGIGALLAGNAKLANHKFMPASVVTIPKY